MNEPFPEFDRKSQRPASFFNTGLPGAWDWQEDPSLTQIIGEETQTIISLIIQLSFWWT